MITRAIFLVLLLVGAAPLCRATRFIAVVPQQAGAAAGEYEQVRLQTSSRPAVQGDAENGPWADYLATWRRHFADPSHAGTRQRLGLPAADAVAVNVSDGRVMAQSLARSLRVAWNDPRRVETRHFVILADLDPTEAIEIATDLERYFAIWTQLFFPLWKDRQQWDRSDFGAAPRGGSAGDKLRIVVFGNPDQYNAALASEGPGVGRSTGYYSGSARITFLRKAAGDEDSGEARATRYHELTHQLLAEATASRLRTAPGERSGFWLLEGIACYMESTATASGYATVGGWQSSRLQFARHRVLASGQSMPLAQLESLGRLAFQRRGDLAQSYAFAAAHCHRLIDQGDGDGLQEVLDRLAKLYQIRLAGPSAAATGNAPADSVSLEDYLRLSDARLTPLGRDDLMNLCLARCKLSSEALQRIAPQASLRWLDLTAIGVTTVDVVRLYPDPARLEQLSLEATAVDDTLGDWLAAAGALRELDLSWTRAGDASLASLAEGSPLETLWLTGSQVSDASLQTIASIKTLQRVDLQRTAVSADGRERFRKLRPDVALDPLELVAAP